MSLPEPPARLRTSSIETKARGVVSAPLFFPVAARSGAAYPLVAKSNCRYESGRCDLENEDFELSIKPVDYTATQVSLQLASRFPLEQATLGFAEGGAELAPVRMSVGNAEKTQWVAVLPAPASDESLLRVAVRSEGTMFYGEVPVVFLVSRE